MSFIKPRLRAALAVVASICAIGTPVRADNPVVNYIHVSVDSDRQLDCNQLNIEIANVSRDIGLLQSQDEELQNVVAQGAPQSVDYGNKLSNVLGALGGALGSAAVIDAQNSIPGVEASMSTARARVGYLQSLQGSCGNNSQQQQAQQQQPSSPPPASDPDKAANIQKSYEEAFCRLPNHDEAQYWLTNEKSGSVSAMIESHRVWLKGTPAERQDTITRSYFEIFNRKPNGDEMSYWDQQVAATGLTCAEIKRSHENFRRDHPDFR